MRAGARRFARFLDHIRKHDRLWFCRGVDIAEHRCLSAAFSAKHDTRHEGAVSKEKRTSNPNQVAFAPDAHIAKPARTQQSGETVGVRDGQRQLPPEVANIIIAEVGLLSREVRQMAVQSIPLGSSFPAP